jgi:hypothetical protein
VLALTNELRAMLEASRLEVGELREALEGTG